MEYFIGVVPPAALYEQILWIQNQFGDNRAEPHITVKAQGGLTPDRGWMMEVEMVAKRFTPFPVKLTQTQSFGSEVLFLSVDSPQLVKLHFELIERVNPSPAVLAHYFEKDSFIPHLTLGQASHGYGCTDLVAMKQLADKLLERQPMEFKVQFLRIYCKSTATDRYQKVKDVELG